MNSEYSWDQFEEVLNRAGVDTDQIKTVREMLKNKNTYSNSAQTGPDPEGQEKLEPRAPAEKAWADRHTVQSFERSDEVYQDGADKMEMANAPTAPQSAPKPETNVSFTRIKQMMSQ